MNKEDIINYVAQTPYNSNKKVLGDMLDTLMDDNILQSDWSQNDENAKDYIKNRPFYEETNFETYIEEQTVEFIKASYGNQVSAKISDVQIPYNQNKYIITFDGIEYMATMTIGEDSKWIPIVLNDGVTVKVFPSGYIYIESIDYIGQHTIKVAQNINIIHTIDNKYLGIPIYNGGTKNAICLNSSDNVASGEYSHAEGQSTTASGRCSHAEGYNTTAFKNRSHAEGDSTTASGYSSHAEGYNTTASGEYSHAEGQSTTASGRRSHAEGYNTTASGESSHTEGFGTTASGNYSHAEGYNTTASGEYSHAEGYNTTASGKEQHVQGKYNIKDTTNTYSHIVGNGTSTNNLSNSHTLDWSGNAWYKGNVYVGSTSGTNKDEGSKKLATEEYVNTKFTNGLSLGIHTDGKVYIFMDGVPIGNGIEINSVAGQ